MLNRIRGAMQKPHKKDVLFIHGAWASPISFNYIAFKLKDHPNLGDLHYFSYDIQRRTVPQIIKAARHLIDHDIQKDTVVVGHSLGGIISLHLHDSVYTDSIVTAAAPLDGLHMNRFIQGLFILRSQSLSDVFSHSVLIKETQDMEYHKPIDVLVTTNGFNPALYEKNDGVITVKSQQVWYPKSAKIHHVHTNNTEVLVSDPICECISKHLEMKNDRTDHANPGEAQEADPHQP